jgi:hypothetical protein
VRTMVRAGARVGAGWRSAAPGASSRNGLAARWGGQDGKPRYFPRRDISPAQRIALMLGYSIII